MELERYAERYQSEYGLSKPIFGVEKLRGRTSVVEMEHGLSLRHWTDLDWRLTDSPPFQPLTSQELKAISSFVRGLTSPEQARWEYTIERIFERRTYQCGPGHKESSETAYFEGARLRLDSFSANDTAGLWRADISMGPANFNDIMAMMDCCHASLVQERLNLHGIQLGGLNTLSPLIVSPRAAGMLVHEGVGHVFEESDPRSIGRIRRYLSTAKTTLSVTVDPVDAHTWGYSSIDEATGEHNSAVELITPRGEIRSVPNIYRLETHRTSPIPRISHLRVMPSTEGLQEATKGLAEYVYVESISRASYIPRLERVIAQCGSGVKVIGDQRLALTQFRVAMSLQDFYEGLIGVGSIPEMISGHCYKQGQRVRVSTHSPGLAFAKAHVQSKDRP